MDMNLDLALSWLRDFDSHFNNRLSNRTAEDNVEVCIKLLQSDDAKEFFSESFLSDLGKQVLIRKTSVIKNAESRIERIKRVI